MQTNSPRRSFSSRTVKETRMSEIYLPLIDLAGCLSWGVEIPPCQAACPLSIDIEGYISAIAEGNPRRALQIIREKCPLPSICGRVCHHPCEHDCKRGKVDDPIAIRELKRFAADLGDDAGERPEPAARTREACVAIIGSGPAGLTAAHDLVKRGYGVTIFESLPVAGGMLACGIPEFDLPGEIVQGEIDSLRALGVEIKIGHPIGPGEPLEALWPAPYQAVLIAVGAQGPAPLPIPGENLEGVIYALPFLREVKIGGKASLKGRGVIIGGGNVAIDGARTAVRLGAGSVDLVCIESREIMPAFAWMIRLAESEGVRIHSALAPQAFGSSDGKKVDRVELRRVARSDRDEKGRVNWTLAEGPGSEESLAADWVMIAIGQKPDWEKRGGFQKLAESRGGTLAANPAHGATNVTGVFAAGDIVEMPGTVVESMAAGRRAAAAIDLYLQGLDLPREPSPVPEPPVTGKDRLPEDLPPERRQEPALRPAGESVKTFQEVILGLSKEQAVQEAGRCLQCKTCNRCLREVNCVALFGVEHQGKRSPRVRGNLCEGCGRCARACPYRNIYLTQV